MSNAEVNISKLKSKNLQHESVWELLVCRQCASATKNTLMAHQCWVKPTRDILQIHTLLVVLFCKERRGVKRPLKVSLAKKLPVSIVDHGALGPPCEPLFGAGQCVLEVGCQAHNINP